MSQALCRNMEGVVSAGMARDKGRVSFVFLCPRGLVGLSKEMTVLGKCFLKRRLSSLTWNMLRQVFFMDFDC